MDLSEFDFHLPDERIALRPAEPRDASRLLVKIGNQPIKDAVFRDIGDFLKPGDLLIANNTRVFPALLFGQRLARDLNGQDIDVQVNLLEKEECGTWVCLARPGKRLKEGDRIRFSDSLSAVLVEKRMLGEIRLDFDMPEPDFWAAIHEIGRMPIPPYIAKKRASDAQDHADYQTVYADQAGSVAAPTAGLHFTAPLIESLKKQGINMKFVTLHVGAGTFAPLTDEALSRGSLHSEWCEVSPETVAAVRAAKTNGNRVIAVGTTALRTLEARSAQTGQLEAGAGETDIFIQPGYEFKTVDGLVTNFHLPKSSLFMLVSALMGTDIMQSCYAHAIKSGYGFYSYGDASLLIPND